MCEATGNSRNGYRDRRPKTCVGGPQPARTQTQDQQLLPGDVIERYQRVDRALAPAVAEMYATGTSTRKIQRIAEKMGVSRLSKDQGQLLIVDVHKEPHARRLPEVLLRGAAEGEAGLDEPDATP